MTHLTCGYTAATDCHMRNGQRTVDGRTLDLVERYFGAEATADALARAKKIRAAGGFVRVVRYGTIDVAVFALGGQPW